MSKSHEQVVERTTQSLFRTFIVPFLGFILVCVGTWGVAHYSLKVASLEWRVEKLEEQNRQILLNVEDYVEKIVKEVRYI